MDTSNKIVLSIGGSLISSNGEIHVDFLKKFNDFVRSELIHKKFSQIFLVVGGGEVSKIYRTSGRSVLGHEPADEDLDWLGIHATKLNAHLIRTIFRDIAHPYVLKHYEIIRKADEPIVVAAGWKPGWSTDFCKTLLCEDYKIKTIVNLSSVTTLFDKDPRKYSDVHPVSHISWEEFSKIVGNTWSPYLNAPFDPIATKKAQDLSLKVVILKGSNFENLKNYFQGKDFIGTTIE